jgi:hypothetical protein
VSKATSVRAALSALTISLIVVGVTVGLAWRGPTPTVASVVVLALLVMLAEHQVVELPEQTDITAGFVLGVAAIVVFHDQGNALLGPFLVGLCGGIYWPHIRNGEWHKMLVNCANYGISMLLAAMVFDALVPAGTPEPLVLVLLAIPTSIVFAISNWLLLEAGIFAFTGGFGPGRVVPISFLHLSPFAVLGVLFGYLYVDFGPVIAPLLIVPILVARQTYGSYLALRESQEATVRILIGALEAKDRYTAGHAERVARYAGYIGHELGLPPSRQERLRFAALMHDVGKLIVPNHLLNKPGKLTAAEFEQVRMHEDVSVEILTRIDFLAPVAPSALSEHTRFRPVADERGQPIEPHIVAVADAFDAMTSTRSYRKALSQEVAFAELRKNAGEQFHPRVVDALIKAIVRRGERHGAGEAEELHDFRFTPPEAGTGSAGLGDLMPEPDDEPIERSS